MSDSWIDRCLRLVRQVARMTRSVFMGSAGLLRESLGGVSNGISRLLVAMLPLGVLVLLVGSVVVAVPMLRAAAASEPKPPVPPVPMGPAPGSVDERSGLAVEKRFAFDRCGLEEERLGESAGGVLLQDLVARFQREGVRQVVVVGHADRIGTKQAVDRCAQRRAIAVRAALVQAGLDPDIVVAVGVGAALPLAGSGCGAKDDARTVACLAPDRRVDIWAASREKKAPASAPG